MSVLYPLLFASIGLAVISHRRSSFDHMRNAYVSKDKFFYLILAVVLILFAGLRTAYNDTGTYVNGYEHISLDGGILTCIDWKIGSNPGFAMTNRTLASLGFSAQSFLLFYAAITIGIYLWFIRKYTSNLWFSVFLFIMLGTYTFTLAAIKQCVAVAFCLVGVDRAINRKWVPFLLWILLGVLFHPYSFMYLIVPLLVFRPWSGKTYIMLGAFIVAGLLLQSLMNTVIDVTTMLGEEYDAASFSGEGVNPFRLTVVSVPVIISFVNRRQIWQEDNRTQNVILNLTMLNAAIMFVALFGTANYFARLANYFLIFQTLSLPYLLSQFATKKKNVITLAAVICYYAYFYYGNAINQPFDNYYSSISLMDYLKSVF